MNSPITRLSYLLIAGITGVGAFTAGEASGNSNFKLLGVSLGIATVSVFIIRQVITYAVNKLIERWEAIPREIERVRTEAQGNFEALGNTLSALTTSVSSIERKMAVENGTNHEWKRGVERRLISLERIAYGQVRAGDLPEELEIDLPEEKK